MREILFLVAFVYYASEIFLSLYITRTKVKPTAEKYGNIEWEELSTIDWYRVEFIEYRKICKENGLSLLYSNISNALAVGGIVIFLLLVFTAGC